MKITLCLIVWNELKGCQIDVPTLPFDKFEEVFVIDGGSTDGTVEYLYSLGLAVHKQKKRGLNAAYVQANQLASGDAVVVFFPKGTLPVEDVLKFRPLFVSGFDLIVASRQLPESINEEDVSYWRPRKWAVNILGAFAAAIWRREGYIVGDVLHGFKGWNRDAFDRMLILDYGLSIDIEMVVRSYRLKISRTEFPTKELARGYGDTHFKVWPTGKKLLAYLWFELFRNE
jgi:glycosyltransferase involved in cell wall biosynthesis